MPNPTISHDSRSDSYLVRDASGAILAGAATDITGRWTWWSRGTRGRRVAVESREAAVSALGSVR